MTTVTVIEEVISLTQEIVETVTVTVAEHSGVTDHGALTGLSDDDHTQYHNDARGDARYALIAQGVTNGDSHDHSGGDGAQIAYSGLSGLPTLGSAAATDSTAYATAAQGSTADTALQPGDDAADLGSGAATDGYVLTADGAGGAAWEAAAETYAGAASEIHAATEKTTPVDADELGLADSAASYVLKKLSWANLKATLSSVFAVLAGKSGGQTIIGGTGTTDSLVLQSTSGVGATGANIKLNVGNNGAVTGLAVDNTGIVTFNSGINFSQVTAPSAPGLELQAVAGNVPVGTHRYVVTYVTDIGETTISDVSAVTVSSGNQQVLMTIPVSSDSRVKSRYIYRDNNDYGFSRIAILSDNTTTSYIDNNVSGDPNNDIWYSTNTTNKIFTFNDTSKIITVNSQNTALGELSLNNLTTGKSTTAVGYCAGYAITSGNSGTYVGYLAGYVVSTGSYNCCIGSYAGFKHNFSANTFIGFSAGHNYIGDVSGDYNVIVGALSGGGGTANNYLGDTAAASCIVIGAYAGFASNAAMNNSIAIGYDCLIDKSNQAIFGNSSITETILRGTVYIKKTTEQLRLQYDATYYASFTVNSSGALTQTAIGGQTLIGGTGVTDKIVLQGTSANGTSTAAALEMKVGNNGATTAMTIKNDGNIYVPGILENTTSGEGIILKSPDGTRYKVTVANGGTLSVSAA